MKWVYGLMSFLTVTFISLIAFASETTGEAAKAGDGNGLIAIGAGLAMGLAALGGGMGQGRAASGAIEAMGRNPGANLFTPLIVSLAMIESLVLFSFLIAYLLFGKI